MCFILCDYNLRKAVSESLKSQYKFAFPLALIFG